MLTIYSAHGSPGASTTALYLAAQWASAGTEVLLIEADPGGGSLSHHLGIQFTPGSASFVASGLPVGGGNLIDHSQDVLFSNLHVMPLTSSPTGAREIVKWLAERAGEVRDVAEAEMAVVVDGGRITADTASDALTTFAAGVAVVARGDSSPTSLEHIGALLSPDVCGESVERRVVTVGDSPLSEEEWLERCDMTFSGAIKEADGVAGDLAAFLDRNKRKSKRWRVSLEQVAEELLPLAKPEAGGARPPSADAPVEEAPAAAEVSAPAPPAVAHVEPEYRPGEPEFAAPQDPHHAAPAAAYGEVAPPFDPRYQQDSDSPYAAAPAPDPYGQYPPELQHHPYAEQPPVPPEHAYHEAGPPFYDAQLPVYQPPPPGAPPPEHPGAPPPQQPAAYPQHPPAPQQPYQQPSEPPPAYQPPPQPYAQPPEAAPPPPQQPVQPPPQQYPVPQPPPVPAAPPTTGAHPPAATPPPPAEPASPAPGAPEPPSPEVAASGSFRDWAARMHGQAASETPNHGHGGAS